MKREVKKSAERRVKIEVKDTCFALYLVLLSQKFWIAGSAPARGPEDEAVAGFGCDTVD